MTEIRNILVQIGKVLETVDEFLAKGLQYDEQIYISPNIQWLEAGHPLELQIVDRGDETHDRDGSVRRAQLNITLAILLRRPRQFQGKHASILSHIDEDVQTYARAIRATLDGNFLPATLIANEPEEDLVVRPLVYLGSSGVMSNDAYPDLLIKEMRFTGGMNDGL